MRKQIIFGFLVAAVCMYFAFRGISVRETAGVIAAAKGRWLVLAMAVYASGFVLRAVRWAILVAPIQRLSPLKLFPVMIIGFLANNLLPFRMGEFVRAHITGRKFKISRTASLGTILLERLFDTIAFLTTFATVAMFFKFPPTVKRAAAALALMCLGLFLGLFLLVYRRGWFDRLVHASPVPPRWSEKVLEMADHFTHGVAGVFQPKFVTASMALSLVIWIIEGTVLFLIAKSFNTPLGYSQSFFLLFFMGLAVTLPQAPGFVGTLELFGVYAMGILGIPKAVALPVILTIHGCQFLFIVTVGLICLWHEGMSLRGLAEETEREHEARVTADA